MVIFKEWKVSTYRLVFKKRNTHTYKRSKGEAYTKI